MGADIQRSILIDLCQAVGVLDKEQSAFEPTSKLSDPLVRPDFFGLAAILQRDEPALDGTERRNTCQQQQRQCRHQMHPDGRPEGHLEPETEDDDRHASDHHDKKSRSVSGIGKAVIEPTDLTVFTQSEEAIKQMALSTMGTLPQKASFPDRHVVVHSVHFSMLISLEPTEALGPITISLITKRLA